MVNEAAENGEPMIFARMGVLQAIYGYQVKEFDATRKPDHWGKEAEAKRAMSTVWISVRHQQEVGDVDHLKGLRQLQARKVWLLSHALANRIGSQVRAR